MIRFFLIPFLLLSVSFSQTVESWILPWDEGNRWQTDNLIEDAASWIWELSYIGETEKNITQLADITVYKQRLNLSVEQIIQGIGRGIRDNYASGKLTIIEKHTGFDVATKWGIILIESELYRMTNEPRSVMYMVVAGNKHTFVISRSINQEKLKGSLKRQWEKFYKSGYLSNESMESTLKKIK